MKVLQLADHFPPDAGGLAVQVMRLAEGLSARGVETLVVAVGERASAERMNGYELRRRPHLFGRLPGVYQEGSPQFHPPWPDPQFRHGLAALVADFQPDVIHVHGWSVFSAAGLGSECPPIVCSLHDYGMRCPKKSLLRFDEICRFGRGRHCLSCDSAAQPLPRRAALAGAIGISWPWLRSRVFRFLAVSRYVQERHVEGGVSPEQITVIPPLTDVLPDAEPRTQPDGRPYVLYVGPGDEGAHKGRARLIRAFEMLQRDSHALLLVGGKNPLRSENRLINDAGYLHGDALVSAFRGASLAVVPSIWADPCPLVAVEALSVGVPVIASDTGGLRDIVSNGISGLLVPPNDAPALARALEATLADERLRREMSVNARASVHRFTGDEIFPELLATYQEAIGSPTS